MGVSIRFFLFFSISLQLFADHFDAVTPSLPDEIASLNRDLLIEGFVSAASGQISKVESDLHIKGAQDLILQRVYVPPQILGRYDEQKEKIS